MFEMLKEFFGRILTLSQKCDAFRVFGRFVKDKITFKIPYNQFGKPKRQGQGRIMQLVQDVLLRLTLILEQDSNLTETYFFGKTILSGLPK